MRGLVVTKTEEDPYRDKLAWFRQNERPETLLLVADDAKRIEVVLAWTSLRVCRAERLTPLLGESECDIWDWLWENTQYSAAELMDNMGASLSELALERRMKPLVGNRVLYPDGTVNSFVQRYLRDRVVRLFDPKPKRPAKKNS